MKRYIFPIITLLILVFTSCEDVIEVKLSDEEVDLYAVEAKITTEDNAYVYVYKGIRVDNSEAYPGVSGATVRITDNSQPAKSLVLVENPETNGLYEVPENESYIGETGKEYTLSIEHEGITLTANDILHKVEPIDSIQVRPSFRGEKQFLGVFTYGYETPVQGNYYKWDIYVNDSLLNDAEYMMVASDELIDDGKYVENFEIFTDFHDPNDDSERILNFMDTIYVNQTSISETAYYFYYQLIEQSFSGGLFSVPNANVKGNFTSSDGKTVLGIFTAQDISKSNNVIIDEEIENQLE